jgi:hypothetical protein
VFSRQTPRKGNPPAITVNPHCRIGINQAAVRLLQLQAGGPALLLWDAENQKIGIRKATDSDPRAYTVTPSTKGSGFQAKTFFSFIGAYIMESVTLEAQWNEKESLLEVSLPAKLFKRTLADQSGGKAQSKGKRG